MNDINKAIDLIGNFLIVCTIPFDQVIPIISAFIKVGALVKSFGGLTMAEQNKFAELEMKMNQLSDKLDNMVGELKAFIVEYRFTEDVVQIASTLKQYMRDVLKNGKNKNIDIAQFGELCKQNPPLLYARKVVSLLKIDTTNPLKMAMNADNLKTVATYDRWRRIIETVLNDFLILECFLNGLLWNSDGIGPNKLRDDVKTAHQMLDKWEDEYRRSYWPQVVQSLIERTQNDNQHVGNDAKALIIKEALKKVLTNDAFYVIVYDHCGGYDKHSFYGWNYVHSFRRGKCNVVVYRSREWRLCWESEKFGRLRNQVEACHQNVLKELRGKNDNFENVPEKLLNDRFDDCNFVGIIKKNVNPAFRTANRFKEGEGYGWKILAEYKYIERVAIPRFQSQNIDRTDYYWLIAGFK